LHRLEHSTFSRRASWFSALCDQAAATAPARGKQAAETVDRLPARLLYVHGD